MNVKAFSTCLVAASLVLAGCAPTATVTQTGKYDIIVSAEQVRVFRQDSEVGKPFTTVGKIDYSDPGKFQNLTVYHVLPVIKERAAAIGGNGVIIDREEVIYSGIISRGVDVTARAIKF